MSILVDASSIKPRLVFKTWHDLAVAALPAAQTLADDFRKIYGGSAIIAKILAIIAQRAKTV